ncbi:MAG TPA: hypothetical protein VKB24_03865 [Candidatus Acidoferrum sp.]|nr:hypothetical protein [Candidatus Acidoferrum sp.]
MPAPAHSGSAPGRVTVFRNSPADTQTRQIKVYLDGQNQGELMFGDSMTLDAAPGAHVLRVDNTWNRKDLAIEVRPGDDLQFLTKSSAGKFVWFLLGFLGAGPMRVSIEPLPSRPPEA